MNDSMILKYSSEDSYNTDKSNFYPSNVASNYATFEVSFDDINYIYTFKATEGESYLESLSKNWTYSDFISSVNDSSSKVEIYFSNRGNFKLIIVDDSYKQTTIITLQ